MTRDGIDDRVPPMLSESLSARPPDVPLAQAEELVARHYGVAARASSLTSERDQNFHLRAADGAEYVLKISNPAEDPEIADFQVAALLHIARADPTLPVQRVLAARDGETTLLLRLGEGCRAVRLLSYLPGTPLNTIARTRAQRRNLGAVLARLGIALRDFAHPAAGHDLAWDIKNASRLRGLLEHIESPEKRELARRFLDNFERHAKPLLPGLRAQVVHNDLNAYNVLVDPLDHDRIAGVLDFGDMVHTALVNDVAIGASYHVASGENPLEPALEFVGAYNDVLPLEPGEVDILHDLIAARFVTTVAITGWRAARYPENSAYILKNNPAAWNGLAQLAAVPRDRVQALFRRACNLE